ncbi:4-hydroxy-tetrahydrodipicolinate reductase 1, chloroplastic-like [Olea europaea subsp. europaea]|uniref:4-hydroxy-tetrahydrodipicolinate reductase 1, chloroplastic-like n=1 Tax=Olea europaea subsp. europaea TaxID=158383 RepID=A0A8S0SRM6_OLEEU|nr:4-hydroxy-tetrahydrodipicolinate reductase 1, chloroplastic-like [Olea europaea subsp. europaea]
MALMVKLPINAALATQQHKIMPIPWSCGRSIGRNVSINVSKRRNFMVATASTPAQSVEFANTNTSQNVGLPIMVNGCTGKMGRAVLEAAISAGLHPVPLALGGPEDNGKIVDVGGKEIEIHGMSQREDILSSVLNEYPNLIVVDYTVPAAVNENAALYCKVGVPFVLGTTGGDRELLYKTVADSNVYAVISPQMGKQVVAFLAAMEIMAEQFPGAFSGYHLQVMESHQASKLDVSGTAKAIISCFQKLGVSFELDQVRLGCSL